ncbi:DNA polymerase III subunit chi [Candidatus Gillettellia adelgis]
MKTVTFYLLKHNKSEGVLSAHEVLVCALSIECWRSGKSLLIACENQEQARRLDEALWQYEPPAFVPHNLVGEGPNLGAPVELCWPGKHGNTARDLLISLQRQCTDFVSAFHQVIDFVPHEATLKQLARDRYKVYRRIGFHLATAMPPTQLIVK